jgi:hypothetical protein
VPEEKVRRVRVLQGQARAEANPQENHSENPVKTKQDRRRAPLGIKEPRHHLLDRVAKKIQDRQAKLLKERAQIPGGQERRKVLGSVPIFRKRGAQTGNGAQRSHSPGRHQILKRKGWANAVVSLQHPAKPFDHPAPEQLQIKNLFQQEIQAGVETQAKRELSQDFPGPEARTEGKVAESLSVSHIRKPTSQGRNAKARVKGEDETPMLPRAIR